MYDLTAVLKAFGRFPHLKLKICSPKAGWQESLSYYKPHLSVNIEVVHLVDKAAQELLSKAKYALSYFPDSMYRQYATPYKLFDYMSHNLPVICNENDGAGRFVKQNGIGFTMPHAEEQLCHWLQNLPSEDEYWQLRTHIAKIKQDHTWQRRAEYVRDTLTATRSST